MLSFLYIQAPEGTGFTMDGLSAAWQLITVIGALALVLALAYFSIRLMGRARGAGGRSQRNVKMVEALGVGPHNSVQLIQAGDKFFLIGVSRNGITLLGEVNGESLTIDSKPLPAMPFEGYLSRFMPKKKGGEGDDNQPKE